jgi:hypothetical protein
MTRSSPSARARDDQADPGNINIRPMKDGDADYGSPRRCQHSTSKATKGTPFSSR